MRAYSQYGVSATGSANKTAVGVTAATAVRPSVFEVDVGCVDSPFDYAIATVLQRFTAAGTGTAKTPKPLDPSDVAAVGVAAVAHSAEPTYTADEIMVPLGHNMRVPWRWVAYEGREIRCPATAANGIGIRVTGVLPANNVVEVGTLFWME